MYQHHSEDLLLKLKHQIEQQAQQIALLEDELLVTSSALQEKLAFANALEQDLEHAIYNLNHRNTSQLSKHH